MKGTLGSLLHISSSKRVGEAGMILGEAGMILSGQLYTQLKSGMQALTIHKKSVKVRRMISKNAYGIESPLRSM